MESNKLIIYAEESKAIFWAKILATGKAAKEIQGLSQIETRQNEKLWHIEFGECDCICDDKATLVTAILDIEDKTFTYSTGVCSECGSR